MTAATVPTTDALVTRYADMMGKLGKSPRPAQLGLIRGGLDLANGSRLLVTAPTATGKSLGALIIAGERASRLPRERTIIVTYTKLLMDQYTGSDLDEARMLYPEVRFASLKGAANYLCRVNSRSGPGRGSRYTTLNGSTGDPGEVGDSGLWDAVADADRCSAHDSSDCGFKAAKERAAAADVVISNHALAILHGMNPTIFGAHALMIVDEAHNFPRAADSFGTKVVDLDKVSKELINPDEFSNPDVSEAIALVDKVGKVLDSRSADYLPEAEQVMKAIRLVKMIKPAVANRSDNLTLLKQWLTCAHRAFARRGEVVTQVASVKASGKIKFRRLELSTVDIATTARRGLLTEWTMYGPPDENGEREEFPQSRAVLMMSATTGTPSRPAYVADRCGVPAELLKVASPLDYPNSMRVSLCPTSARVWSDRVAELVEQTGGRSLVLLRSWADVESVTEHLLETFSGNVYVQDRLNPGRNAGQVSRFREDTTSVLVGTMSFFEGINVPGDSLSQVIIGKLPIKMAMSPVDKERVRQSGTSYLNDQQVPHTALVLEQMMGRLIRSVGDRGLVAIMDPAAANGWGRTAVDDALASLGLTVTPRDAALTWFIDN